MIKLIFYDVNFALNTIFLNDFFQLMKKHQWSLMKLPKQYFQLYQDHYKST
jgi:hypothetical protein